MKTQATVKPSEILKGIKKATELKTLKQVQKEIQKVEKLMDTIWAEAGYDYEAVPRSLVIRLESLDHKEAKMLVEAGLDPQKDSITPVKPRVYVAPVEVKEIPAEDVTIIDITGEGATIIPVEPVMMMVVGEKVGEFNPVEAVAAITSKDIFEQTMQQAKDTGYSLVIEKNQKAVVSWEYKENNGREFVELITEAKTKHGFYFDSKTAKISRYAKFVK